MIPPRIPSDEALRLQILRSLNILDTPADENFERLTRIAKRLFQVPMALVSLVDENRQWFKSKQGLDTSETPRNISFCGHAILHDDIFVVENALIDARFSDNPLVVGEPKIRFYAGYPLQAPNGAKLGTLCLKDRVPRTLSKEDRELLRDLGAMAEREIAALHMATVDDLTLLTNRRGFRMLGQNALSICLRMNQPAWMLYFDLDNFKPINDRFGHSEGDNALVTFANILRQTFRESDIVGRMGGDEFVVLMTGSHDIEGKSASERLQIALNQHNQIAQKGYDLHFSVGVSTYDPKKHATIDALIAEADAEMFAHKTSKG